MSSQSASSVNLQIRILLALSLLLLLGLATTKVIQTFDHAGRIRDQGKTIEEQQQRIDNLEMRVTGSLGTNGEALGFLPTGGNDELVARLKELEERNRELTARLSSGGPVALPAEGEAKSTPAPGIGLPRSLDGNGPAPVETAANVPPPVPDFTAPPSPAEQQLEILRRRMNNEQAVGTVGSVAPDGSFVVFEPIGGIDLIGGDKVLVGRDTAEGPEPIAVLLIDSRDPDSGLYVADVLPEDRETINGSVMEDDLVFLLDGQ